MREESNKNSIAAFIFARGGSKGVLGKNIRKICEKPLISFSIEIALENKYIDEVYVSTDDNDIAEVALKYGANVPFTRPSELSDDDSNEWLAWQHAISFLKESNQMPDIMVSLPATSPLRSQDDINSAIERIMEGDLDAVIGITPSQKHPMFNMVKKKDLNLLELYLDDFPEIHRRQDAPPSYDITTVVYAVKSEFILENTQLFDGKVGAIQIPQERALDIDTEFDLKVASLIIESESKD
tara:strand:- start:1165 stop:1884 length:720 start_codon:yes stop_codon:yes gene_type:complete